MLILKKYLDENLSWISQNQKEKLLSLIDIYITWNNKINLVSRKDIDNLDLHHIIHSIILTNLIQKEKFKTIIDVGTGGGFPGIPLAILFPDIKFYLVDSIKKKIDTVCTIANELNLMNVICICDRIENIKINIDCVVGRAVACPVKFFNITKHLIFDDLKLCHNGTILYMSGPSEQVQNCNELKDNFSLEVHACHEFCNNNYFQEKLIYKIFVKN